MNPNELKSAIEQSSNWRQVLIKLGLNPTGANYRYLKYITEKLDIDTSRFVYRKNKARSISENEFANAVVNSSSVANLIKNLGCNETGGTRKVIYDRLANYDTGHFTGQGWSKGLTSKTDSRVARQAESIRKYSDDQLLVENAPYWSNTRLSKILLRKGMLYVCVKCGNDGNWNGEPLSLQVDHISGTGNDNRIENLRFLCPNCHTQTPTWGSRNLGKK